MGPSVSKVQMMSLVLASLMLWHFGGFSIYAQTRAIEKQRKAATNGAAFQKGLAESHFDELLGELKETVRQGAAKTKLAPENGFAGDLQWNFEKFLIDRQGKLIGRYPSGTKPEDNGLLQEIATAL